MTSILVVDDDVSIAEAVADVLRAEGYVVVTAHDGRQALELMERATPDMLITDIMMPHMDGVTLCQQAKTTRVTQTVVVLIMSASSRLDRHLRTCPADATLAKPFDLEELVGLVHRHLSSPEDQSAQREA